MCITYTYNLLGNKIIHIAFMYNILQNKLIDIFFYKAIKVYTKFLCIFSPSGNECKYREKLMSEKGCNFRVSATCS
jgi:hypothetical protein